MQKLLWEHAESHVPESRIADYTQAMMDLGATICTRSRPRCTECPLYTDCVALRDELTAQLPESKPQRAIPSRSTMMLILRDASGRLLLRRRPPTGVWAELWSLPEAGDIDIAKREVAAIHVSRGSDIDFERLPNFTHVFSHYKLDIAPLAFDIVTKSGVADSATQRWVSPTEAAKLGLPAPVRKLIEQLKESK